MTTHHTTEPPALRVRLDLPSRRADGIVETRRITVECDGTDHPLEDLMEIIRQALDASGYGHEAIQEYFRDE